MHYGVYTDVHVNDELLGEGGVGGGCTAQITLMVGFEERVR